VNDLRIRLGQNGGALAAFALFLVLYVTYCAMHPRGFSSDLLVQNSNEATTLILLAMAQTLPVLLGGIDLSVGALMTLVNATASVIVDGTPGQVLLGCLACVALGALGGLPNGVVIVFGRLQPIVVTLATGAVFNGVALFIRPTPGGRVDGDLGWVMTNALAEWPLTYGWWEEGAPGWFEAVAWIPTPIVFVGLVVLLVWLPFRSSETGRAVYAVGSNEAGAYMSGVKVDRAKLAAYSSAASSPGSVGSISRSRPAAATPIRSRRAPTR